MKIYSLLFLTFILSACGQEFNNDASSIQDGQFNAITCSCTSNYDPVCAFVDNRYVTYTNSCLAQCAGVDFSQGMCNQNISRANNQTCNPNSGLVCARPAAHCEQGTVCATVLPQPKYYSNECEMILQNATPVDPSQCN